jgi:hypothetical protein
MLMTGEGECFSCLPGGERSVQVRHVNPGAGRSNLELVPVDHKDSLSWCDHSGVPIVGSAQPGQIAREDSHFLSRRSGGLGTP